MKHNWPLLGIQMIPNVGTDIGKEKLLYAVGSSASLCNYFGNHPGGFF